MRQKSKSGKRTKIKSKINRQLIAARLNPVTSFIRTALPAGLLFGLHAGSAYAGPEGGVVAGGEGTISTPNVTTTNINQASQNLIVNWESFNVNANEAVNFIQPNAQAQALNRIFDQNPSQIFGSVNANGKVLLINPNGVFFKPGASVNVNGLVASGLDISNENFMNGNHQFFNAAGSEGGLVVNQGTIQAATGGSVSLIGGAVRNEGTIIATAGQVNLVAGKKVTMDFVGDGLIQFTVDEEILQNVHDLDDAVSNTGTINADGGSVLLKGSAAKDVFTNVVNNSGMIGAAKIENKGGVIKLVAGGTSNSLINTGTLNASSTDSDGGTIEIYASDTAIISEDALITAVSSTGNGGKITVTGDKVGLLYNARIDVSGATGGGKVLIGGDYQGKNSDVQNATATYIGSDATVHADALDAGDGGTVVVWADEVTRAHGTFTARGGANSGDGGLIETSGKIQLDVAGIKLDASAPNGKGGLWFLDPFSVEIDATADTAVTGSPNFLTTGTGAKVNVTTIEGLLNADTDVSITTSDGAGGGTEAGDITLKSTAGAIDVNNVGGDTNATFTLTAAGDIIFETGSGGINTTGGVLNVVLTANDNTGGAGGQNDQNTAAGSVDLNAAITTNGGNFTSTGVDFDNTGGVINAGAGAVSITQTGIVTVGANITSGSTTDITSTADDTGAGVTFTHTGGTISSTGGALNITADDMNLASTITAGGQIVTLKSNTTTDVINLGSTGTTTAGTLELSDAELDTITTTNAKRIGASTQGTITVSAALSLANNLTLITGADVTQGANAITGLSGLSIDAGTTTTLNANNDVGSLSANLSTASAAFSFTDINALTLGTVDSLSGVSTNNGAINLSSVGMTINSNVDAGNGTVTLDANTGTLTVGVSAEVLSTGIINATADQYVINATGQIGGATGFTSNAATVTLAANTATTMGIDGGAGTIQLDEAELNRVRSTNVRLGDTTNTGAIIVGGGTAWAPTGAFATGVLTLASNAGITQGAGGIDLSTSTSDLIIRAGAAVTLTDTSNNFSNVAANVTVGALQLTDAGAFSVSSLTDDIGTVAGVTAVGGATLTATGAQLTVGDAVTTTNTAINLNGTGITLTTANSDVSSGSGNVVIDAGMGLFNMAASSSVVTGTGNVTIAADSAALAGAITSTSGVVKVAPDTAATVIELGVGATNGLALTDTELNTIQAVTVRIGDGTGAAPYAAATSGNITFTGAFNADAAFATGVLELQTTGTVTGTAGAILLNTSTSDLVVRAGGAVNLGTAAHNFNTVAVTTGASASAVTINDGVDTLTIGTVDSLDGVVTGGGAINITSTGALTVAHQVDNTGANAINLTGAGVDLTTANSDVGASTAGKVTVNAGTGTLALSNAGASIATTLAGGSAVDLIGDSMNLTGTVTAGGAGAEVLIKASTAGTAINLGATAAANLALTDTELNQIAADVVRIGDATTTGAITFVGNFTSGATFADTTLGLRTSGTAAVTQSGGTIDLSAGTSDLVVRNGSGNVTLSDTSNNFVNVAVSTTGVVNIQDTNALTVTTVDSINGITGTNGVTLNGGAGLLSILQDVSSTNDAISLSGTGITVNSGASSVDAGSGTVTLDANMGTLTVSAAAEVLGTGIINATADQYVINATGQIGGATGFTSNAATVTLAANTATTTMGIDGGAGTIQLDEAELNRVRSTNVRLGDTTNTGAIIMGGGTAWAPTGAFATGVLTLASNAGITQGAGGIDLSTSTSDLIIRAGAAVTLTDTGNNFSNVAATLSAGALQLLDTNTFTVASLTDDIGTVNGISAVGAVTLTANSGVLTLGSQNVTGAGVNLIGTGVTSTGGTVDGGAGLILVDANNGAISLAGALTTTSTSTTAVRIIDATTVALGNITAGVGATGTVVLGEAAGNNISGAVTQTGIITANTLIGNTGSTVVLGGANELVNLGAFTTTNTFTLNDNSGGLTLTGVVTTGGTGAASITTTGGALALGTNDVTGAGVNLIGTGVTSSAASTVTGGAGDILVDGNDGAINLAGALTTTSVTGTAVQIIDATTAALGNITVGTGATGTVVLGQAGVNNLSGAVTQTGIITANTLIGNTGSTVVLGGNNVITNLGAFTSNGAFSLNDNAGGLNVTGTFDNTTGTASIVTTGGALAIGAGIDAAGFGLTLTGVGVTQSTGTILASTANVTAGAGVITLTQATNDFTGAIDLSNSGANVVTVTDANSLTLGTVNVGDNLNINIDAGADDTASLDVSTASITAGATITVDGQGTNDTLLGTNAANTWTITGANAGNFNNGTETINFTDFGNITGGSNTDSFNFTMGSITNAVGGGTGAVNDTLTYAGGSATTVVLTNTGTVDGFRGTATSLGTFDNINILTGSGNTDSLTGLNAGATWTVNGGGTSYVASARTLTFSAMENLTGGTGTDVFNVDGAHSGNLSGGAGADDFNFNTGAVTGNIDGGADADTFDFNGGTVTGNIDGQAGTDILDYAGDAGAITITITGTGATDGFAGTTTRVTGTFDDINTLVGSAGTDTLIGDDTTSTFNISTANAGTYVQTNTLTYSSIENLTGGSAADTFNIASGATLTGTIAGGGGTDTLTQADGANTWDVTGANSGDVTDIGDFNGIENLTGGTGDDTFNINNTLSGLIDGGTAGNDTADFNVATTVTINGTNTGISNIDTVDMSSAGTLVGSAAANTWLLDITAASGAITVGGVTTNFINTPTIQTGTGTDTFTNPAAGGTYTGNIVVNESTDNRWNYTAGQVLTTGTVTGTGAFQALSAATGPVTIGAGDLNLAPFTGFAGHLVVGGTILNGSTTPATMFAAGAVITSTATTLTVGTPITTTGTISIVAGDILLNSDITAGNTIGLIAAGSPALAGATGDIDASAGPVTLTAPNTADPSGAFLANNTIVSSENITLAFNSGEVDVATGNGDELQFSGTSVNSDTTVNDDFEKFVAAATVNGVTLATSLTTTFSINPASSLIGLVTLAFIDVGLFEEELTLFGQIGTGIALALAQCEEQEGCAPSVTEDEMINLIASLDARLLELERRLAEESDPNVRADLEELIEGYNKELNEFNSYLQQLTEFFAEEEDEDFEEDELDEDLEDEEDLLSEEDSAKEVSQLAKVLETVKSRLVWLISLKANPEERARLGKAINIELTQEALDTIIEATKSEAAFIENQIKLLIEGVITKLNGEAPVITAEARDYNSMQTLHYGTDLLSLDNHSYKPLVNIY